METEEKNKFEDEQERLEKIAADNWEPKPESRESTPEEDYQQTEMEAMRRNGEI